MPIRNYTSSVLPRESAGKIQQILASNGARRVALDYDPGGDLEAIQFVMEVSGRPVAFRVEVDTAGMLAAMENDDGVPSRYCTREQAERTAWKSKLEWLQIQLDEIACGQARMEQLLLGYAVTEDGTTLFKRLQSSDSSLGLLAP